MTSKEQEALDALCDFEKAFCEDLTDFGEGLLETIRTALQSKQAEIERLSGWRPIETAPLNIPIFGHCFENYDQVVIHTEKKDFGDGEVEYWCKSQLTGKYVVVTHWMPLPKPPEKDK